MKNLLSHIQQYGIYDNKIVYRTMSPEHYKQFLNTGMLLATYETSVSPVLEYSSKYERITIKLGTFSQLEEIDIAANLAAAKKFPNMTT